jgi:hypothetical protein
VAQQTSGPSLLPFFSAVPEVIAHDADMHPLSVSQDTARKHLRMDNPEIAKLCSPDSSVLSTGSKKDKITDAKPEFSSKKSFVIP